MQRYCYVGNRARMGISEAPLGITVCRYDEDTGRLTPLDTVAPELNAGSLFLDRQVLYSTDDRPTPPGRRAGQGGRIFAFTIDAGTGRLRELGCWSSYAPMANYAVSFDDYVVLANHGTNGHITTAERDGDGAFHLRLIPDESSLVLYPRHADGSLGAPLDIWKAVGSGPIAHIQDGPHLHSVVLSPSGKLLAVCDKGADRVYLFRVENNRLQIVASCASDPGFAPRYSAFHPTKPFLFVNHEFQPYIDTFHYGEDGALTQAGRTAVLPEGIKAPDTHGQTDILVSTDGRTLYTLFRQINMILVFRIDGHSGALARIQALRSEGKNLRSCAIAPDGRFLLVAAADSGEVLSYPIDAHGTLGPSAARLEQVGPANLIFYSIVGRN